MSRINGPRLKLQRAREHINDLDAAIRLFLESEPFGVQTYQRGRSGEWVHAAIVREQFPIAWSTIIGDALHNLRSSLDLLAYQLVRANHVRPTKRTMYPIASLAKNVDIKLGTKRGPSQDAVALIKATKPHRRGNRTLWRLSGLNNIDKHRLLVPVGAAYSEMAVPYTAFTYVVSPPVRRLFPLENGTVLYSWVESVGPMKHEMNMKAKFTFDVAFGEGRVVKGEPIIPTLSEIAEEVERVLDLFAPLL